MIEANDLQDQIKLIKSKSDLMLKDIIDNSSSQIEMVICNPPFFDCEEIEGVAGISKMIEPEFSTSGGEY